MSPKSANPAGKARGYNYCSTDATGLLPANEVHGGDMGVAICPRGPSRYLARPTRRKWATDRAVLSNGDVPTQGAINSRSLPIGCASLAPRRTLGHN
eukprot:3731368-Pyramimonas_sp.AAC.1